MDDNPKGSWLFPSHGKPDPIAETIKKQPTPPWEKSFWEERITEECENLKLDTCKRLDQMDAIFLVRNSFWDRIKKFFRFKEISQCQPWVRIEKDLGFNPSLAKKLKLHREEKRNLKVARKYWLKNKPKMDQERAARQRSWTKWWNEHRNTLRSKN